MKALIQKDFYVLWKQMRSFLLIVLILSAIPSFYNNVFAVLYAAMLPYTAMGYDERSKWDQLAAMMPYSTRDLVLSKYVLGWLCIAGAAVASLVIQGIMSTVLGTTALSMFTFTLSVCGALCILSITLPLMFRFGVEKGRMAMFLIIFLICGASGAIAAISVSPGDGSVAFGRVALPAAAAAAVILILVSVPLSIKLYQRRR